MKIFKLLAIAFCFLFLTNCAQAIEWEQLTSRHGRTVFLDTDSIQELDGYYFYNIKFKYENASEYIILTVQSQISHPFSARIKAYTLQEYETLRGDYENIFNNKTEKMEPVTYESIVYACYKRVKQLKSLNNDIKIIN